MDTDPYISYYLNQAYNRQQHGGSLPSFGGRAYQRGHGLGDIFRRMRAAIPAFFKSLGNHAVRTAVNIGGDYLMGKNFRNALGARAMEGMRSAANDLGPSLIEGIKSSARDVIPQFGTGKRKRTRRKARAGKTKRRRIDIFS